MGNMDMYEETAITTQSRGRLVVMLYNGAIRSLKQAIDALEAEDYETKGRYIGKAYDIIFELNMALDMEAGGQLSQDLRKLYTFMCTHLNQANSKCDCGMIRDVVVMLQELNEGFKAITV